MKFKQVYIEISNLCNLKCPFCVPTKRENRIMSVAEYRHIINEVAPYTRSVYLHIKGEPFLHPNFKEIIASTKGVFLNITTNGTLLMEHLEDIRYNKGKIHLINISVHSNPYPSYLEEIKQFVSIVSKEELTHLNLRFWVKESHQLIEQFQETPWVKISKDSEFNWPELDGEAFETQGTCLALKHQIGILANGDVVPCCLDQHGSIVFGNIFQESFNNIISNERLIKMKQGFQNKKLVEPLCQRCTYRRRFNGSTSVNN